MIHLDTQVIVAQRTPADVAHDRVNRWLRSLGKERIWIPAPVLLELGAVEKSASDADRVMNELLQRFAVRAFDVPATLEAARCIAAGGGIVALAGEGAGRSKRKQVIRTDAMVLGCVLAAGPQARLYTTDTAIATLAAACGRTDAVVDVPNVPEQGTLDL